mmetsp:Transcript_28393/g.40084  ORF Transcript_28393/g.40084 Transcript_28393/m.40084 type:complete len:128 (+) Transcript_28393:453-836(+)
MWNDFSKKFDPTTLVLANNGVDHVTVACCVSNKLIVISTKGKKQASIWNLDDTSNATVMEGSFVWQDKIVELVYPELTDAEWIPTLKFWSLSGVVTDSCEMSLHNHIVWKGFLVVYNNAKIILYRST